MRAGEDTAGAGRSQLAAELRGISVCICAGAGGVGKTTIAAALALGLAAQGQRVVVVTIDPARRLATALGLDDLGDEPHQIDARALTGGELELDGELWAMMLDPKKTFDELIARLAPNEEARAEVLANHVYRELSSAVGGSQEFTAIAKLYELHTEGGFDMIVLDTPPAQETLDFLDAPGRISRFVEGRALRLLLSPNSYAGRLLGRRGSGVLSATFEQLVGIDLLGELSRFFRALGGMLDGFHEQARAVAGLLRDPATAFLIIASPEREPVRAAKSFAEQLDRAGMRRAALVVNRVHRDGLEGRRLADAEGLLAERLGEPLGRRVARNLADYDLLAQRDGQVLAALANDLDERQPIVISQLDSDISDLPGLARIAARLFS